MPDFFNQSFKEQVSCIIRYGDLKLLQTFIGIRNPIGLSQYYASFITTKINLSNTRLYGEYEVAKRCLIHYRDNVVKDDIKEQSGEQSITDDASSNFRSRIFSEVSTVVRNQLLSNLFTSLSNETNKSFDSICNSKYMHQSNSEQDLVNYTRNTEINNLCSVNMRQVDELYGNLVRKSKVFVRGVIEKYPVGSSEQKDEIKAEISVLTKCILEQKGEIEKYMHVLRQIKDRSFLKEWYTELANTVKINAKTEKDHVLHEYFPKDAGQWVAFMEKLKNQFISEVVSRFLKEFLKGRHSDQFDCLQDILMDQLDDSSRLDYKCFVEQSVAQLTKQIDECDDDELRETIKLIIREIKADKIIRAEQSVLDDILLEAVLQGKQNCALLLICNGANINLERKMEDQSTLRVRERLDKQILDKSGFLVIRELYSDMPSIKANFRVNMDIEKIVKTLKNFAVEGCSQPEENCEEFMVKDIFTLAEIRDIFPENTVLKESADSLTQCEKDKSIMKETVVNKNKLLKELQEKLKSKTDGYTKPSWKWAAAVPLLVIPWYSLVYAAVYVGACVISSIVDIGRPLKARRNAQKELEVSEKDLSRATQMFEVLLEYLQCSVVAGTDIFLERCKEIEAEIKIIKSSKGKWINLANTLKAFEKAQEACGNENSTFFTKSVKFSKLAEDMIFNRLRYIDELCRFDPKSMSCEQTVTVNDEDSVEEDVKKKQEETKEERTAEEEQKAKTEFYENLVLQVRTEKLPLNDLQQMDLTSLDATSSSEE